MNLTFWIVAGVVAVPVAVSMTWKRLTADNQQRKRRRNYGRVTTKQRRPTVMLSTKIK